MSDWWESLERPWQACLEEAWTAYCAGSLPIGAVVVGPDGEILSRGRNRICEAAAEDGAIYGHTLAHAEMNALCALPIRDGNFRHTCALYTTTEPCPLCMGAFYMSSVRTLHYAAREPYAGSVNLLGTTPYLSRKPIQVFGPASPVLEDIITALATEFELTEHSGPNTVVLRAWKEILPKGVCLGEELYQSGELRRSAKDKYPVEAVLSRLERLYAAKNLA